MQAILFCGGMTACIPDQTLPEALLPVCNVPMLEHILRYMEKNGFQRAILTGADEQVRLMAEMLPLKMEIRFLPTVAKLRADMPTLLLRRLCMPAWDAGELRVLCREPVQLVNPDGSVTEAELHPAGSVLLEPARQAVTELSVFRRPETPEEYRVMQQELLAEEQHRRRRLGHGIVYGENVQIDDLSIVGCDCVIGDHVRLERCVIGDGAQIGSGTELRDCVVCRHALVDRQVRTEKAVIPQGAVLQADERSMRIRRRCILPDDGICDGLPRWNTAETALHAGAALTAVSRSLAVGCDSGSGYAAMAAAAGAASQGAHVWFAGQCAVSQLIFAARTADCGAMLFVSGTGSVRLMPMTGDGLPLSDTQSRRLRQALDSRAGSRLTVPGKTDDASGFMALWEEQCRKLRPAAVPEITVSCADRRLRETAQRLLAGGSGEQITVALSEDGTGATFFSMEAGHVRLEQLQLLSLLSVAAQGDALALPADFHPEAERFAEKYGGRILRMRSPEQTPEAYRLFRKQGICTDGLLLSLHVLRVLDSRRLSLRQAVSLLPGLCTVQRTVSTTLPWQAVEKLRRTAEPSVSMVLPPSGRLIRLRAHAGDMETAAELCSRAEKQLRTAELHDGD